MLSKLLWLPLILCVGTLIPTKSPTASSLPNTSLCPKRSTADTRSQLVRGVLYSPLPIGTTPIDSHNKSTGINPMSSRLEALVARDFEVFKDMNYFTHLRLAGYQFNNWTNDIEFLDKVSNSGLGLQIIISFSIRPYVDLIMGSGIPESWGPILRLAFADYWSTFAHHPAVYGITLTDVTDRFISADYRVELAFSTMITIAQELRESNPLTKKTRLINAIFTANFLEPQLLQLSHLDFDEWLFNFGGVPPSQIYRALLAYPKNLLGLNKTVLIGLATSSYSQTTFEVNEMAQVKELDQLLDCADFANVTIPKFRGFVLAEYSDQYWRSVQEAECHAIQPYRQNTCGRRITLTNTLSQVEFNGLFGQVNWFGKHCLVSRLAYFLLRDGAVASNTPLLTKCSQVGVMWQYDVLLSFSPTFRPVPDGILISLFVLIVFGALIRYRFVVVVDHPPPPSGVFDLESELAYLDMLSIEDPKDLAAALEQKSIGEALAALEPKLAGVKASVRVSGNLTHRAQVAALEAQLACQILAAKVADLNSSLFAQASVDIQLVIAKRKLVTLQKRIVEAQKYEDNKHPKDAEDIVVDDSGYLEYMLSNFDLVEESDRKKVETHLNFTRYLEKKKIGKSNDSSCASSQLKIAYATLQAKVYFLRTKQNPDSRSDAEDSKKASENLQKEIRTFLYSSFLHDHLDNKIKRLEEEISKFEDDYETRLEDDKKSPVASSSSSSPETRLVADIAFLEAAIDTSDPAKAERQRSLDQAQEIKSITQAQRAAKRARANSSVELVNVLRAKVAGLPSFQWHLNLPVDPALLPPSSPLLSSCTVVLSLKATTSFYEQTGSLQLAAAMTKKAVDGLIRAEQNAVRIIMNEPAQPPPMTRSLSAFGKAKSYVSRNSRNGKDLDGVLNHNEPQPEKTESEKKEIEEKTAVENLFRLHMEPYQEWCKRRTIPPQIDFQSAGYTTQRRCLYILRLVRDLAELNSFSDSFVAWIFHRTLLRKSEDDELWYVQIDMNDIHYGLRQIKKGEINHDDEDAWALTEAPTDEKSIFDENGALTKIQKQFWESEGPWVWLDFYRNYDLVIWVQVVIFGTALWSSFARNKDSTGEYYIHPDIFSFYGTSIEIGFWMTMEGLLFLRACVSAIAAGRNFRTHGLHAVFPDRFFSVILSWLWGLEVLLHTEKWRAPSKLFGAHVGVRLGWRAFLWIVYMLKDQCVCGEKGAKFLARELPCLNPRLFMPLAPSSNNAKQKWFKFVKSLHWRIARALFWITIGVLQWFIVSYVLSFAIIPLVPSRICHEQCLEMQSNSCVACHVGVAGSWMMSLLFSFALSSMLYYPCVALWSAFLSSSKQVRDPYSKIKLTDGDVRELRKNLKQLFGDCWVRIWALVLQDFFERDWISAKELTSAFLGMVELGDQKVMNALKDDKGEDFPVLRLLKGKNLVEIYDASAEYKITPGNPEVTLPDYAEARMLLSFWIWSVNQLTGKQQHHNDDPDKRFQYQHQKPARVGKLSQILPIYSELITITDANLRTNLKVLVQERPQEWAYLTDRLIRRGVLSEANPDLLKVFEAEKNKKESDQKVSAYVFSWASQRIESVERTLRGALTTHSALRELNKVEPKLKKAVTQVKAGGSTPSGSNAQPWTPSSFPKESGSKGCQDLKKQLLVDQLSTQAEEDVAFINDNGEQKMAEHKTPAPISPVVSQTECQAPNDDLIEFLIGAQTYAAYPTASQHNYSSFGQFRTGLERVLARYSEKNVRIVFPFIVNKPNTHPACAHFQKADTEQVNQLLVGVTAKYLTIEAGIVDGKMKFLSVVPRVFGERIGKTPALSTQGKAANHAQILRLVSGHAVQMYDANMDGTFGEGLKISYIMRSLFSPKENSRHKREFRLVGFPEFIFTLNNGSAGRAMAVADSVFTSSTHRVLHRLAARLHYGHPDIMDSTMLYYGNVSKASPAINLSEDVFKGVDLKLRNFPSQFCEYGMSFKGRESSFIAASAFFAKISMGAFAAQRSRDWMNFSRIPLEFFQSMSHYQGGPGWYMYHLLISWTIHIYVYLFLFFSFAGVSLEDLGLSQTTLGTSWIVDIGAVGVLPLLIKAWEDRGPGCWITSSWVVDTLLSSVFFIFQNQVVAWHFKNSAFTGTATYLGTGRPAYFEDKVTKIEGLKMYFCSHYITAVRLIFAFIIYAALNEFSNFMPMFLTLGTAGIWLVAPVLFVPAHLARSWAYVWQDTKSALKFIAGGTSSNGEDFAAQVVGWSRDEIELPIFAIVLLFLEASIKFLLCFFCFPSVAFDSAITLARYILPLHFLCVVYQGLAASPHWLSILVSLWPFLGFFLAGCIGSYRTPFFGFGLDSVLGALLILFFMEVPYYLFWIVYTGLGLKRKRPLYWNKNPALKATPTSTWRERGPTSPRLLELMLKLSMSFHMKIITALLVLIVQTAVQLSWCVISLFAAKSVGICCRKAKRDDDTSLTPLLVP